LVSTPTGDVIRETVTNVDPLGRLIWVDRRIRVVQRQVALEELMPNDPLITGAAPLDVEELLFGVPLITEEPAPSPGDTESMVVSYGVFANLPVLVGDSWEDAVGPMIGTVLTAQIFHGTNCTQELMPVVTDQPQNTTAPYDGRADFSITADVSPDGGEVIYQWQHEGVDIEGEDQPAMHVDPVLLSSAGAYVCVVTNDCGFVSSHAATLAVEVPVAIDTQPESLTLNSGSTAKFKVEADTMLSPNYTWSHNGVPITPEYPHYAVSSGSNGMSSVLIIRDVTSSDAGTYSVEVYNDFASVTSDLVTLTVTGCDFRTCAADFNQDGGVDGSDVEAFFRSWEMGNCEADANRDGGIDGADVETFFTAWQAGGC